MKRIQKWSALLMAVTLLFTLAAPAALAAESTVTIKTAEDLAELSRNCTLDTWSQGKTVILENDLDLHSIDFTPIPTFSGTPDKRIPPRTLPIVEVSSAAFFVYRAAILDRFL